MQTLTTQRCLHHPVREAVARCPECAQFYCRECIVEHDERILCASCIKRTAAPSPGRARKFTGAMDLSLAVLGFALAWGLVYAFGRMLLLIPTTFHDGTVWHHLNQ